jgi:ubiquitin carboxyl-terminal hydrolase 5/13
MFSFDSPLSPGGLYLNLTTWQAFSERYLPLDAERSGAKLYLWEKWHKARHPLAPRRWLARVRKAEQGVRDRLQSQLKCGTGFFGAS